MDLALTPARALLFTLAGRWDDARPEDRAALEPAVAACKVAALQAALAAVDEALRVAGAAGLGRDLPLERHYRDVRCGLHNPPMEDVVFGLLARTAVAEVAVPPTD
jgi:alkylation response protein AidB-like acyl-CoA dehydrogenase